MDSSIHNVYLVGIKGFGVASLAAMLVKMGYSVSGSDIDERFPTDELIQKHNIPFFIGFKPENVPANCDVVITTGAHGGLNNPEVLEAQKRGIPTWTLAEGVGKVMSVFDKRVAVCGTHGKTTTSALMSFLMYKMECQLGYQVGAPSFSGLEGGGYTGKEYFVVEADEYVASLGTDNTPRFMYLNPTHILCTTIDYDHVDVYKDLEAVKEAFRKFFAKLDGGKLIYNLDDLHTQEVASEFPAHSISSYGFSESADAFIHSVVSEGNVSTFHLKIHGENFGPFKLTLPGKHNIQNAAGALLTMHLLGLDIQKASEYISEFTGSKRRYEKIFEEKDVVLIDDYAHHPTEIAATIQAIRTAYPHRNLTVLFQPHMFTRTKALEDDFIKALGHADQTLLLDIFASARENNRTPDINSSDIVQRAKEMGIYTIEYRPSSDLQSYLESHLTQNSVLVTMGATDIWTYHPAIIELIKKLCHS